VIIGSRGQARLGLGDIEGAVKDLTDALDRKPDMAWALISRSTAYLAQHDVQRAIADRRRLVQLRPADVDAWAAYAMMLLETKQPEVLWNELSDATRAIPDLLKTAPIHGLLAQAAIAMGRFADAERHFRTSAELEPADDFWKYEEARAMRHQGLTDAARARVGEALAQQVVPSAGAPSYLAISSNRCLYLLALERFQEAERGWQDLLRRDVEPSLLRTQLEELDALRASGHDSPAMERIRNSVQLRLEELASGVAV
jgi:tetratricopeptide (TPR) repeat protein